MSFPLLWRKLCERAWLSEYTALVVANMVPDDFNLISEKDTAMFSQSPIFFSIIKRTVELGIDWGSSSLVHTL